MRTARGFSRLRPLLSWPILPEHWHRQKCARPGNFHRSRPRGFALRVRRLGFDIGDVNRFLCLKQASKRILRVRSWWFLAKIVDESRCRISYCFDAKYVAVEAVHDAEFCLADPGRFFQYDVEYWREVAWRAVDDPQDLGRSGLVGTSAFPRNEG